MIRPDQHKAVKKQFQEQISIYTRKKQGTDSYLIPLILKWFSNSRQKRKINVCEFGGASGQLLHVIEKRYPNASYTIAEIVPEYCKHLASNKFIFELRSILDSGFKDKSFDIIIVRDIFHHLVSGNIAMTKRNQYNAVVELKRLIRPGGAIFIEELTIKPALISQVIYLITLINSKIGIKIPFLSLNPNIIVYFMTSKSLTENFMSVFRENKISKKIIIFKMTIKDYLIHPGACFEKVLLTIKI